MTPKETYSLVLARAKQGALIDRIGRVIYYIAFWLGMIWSLFPIPLTFFPREYFMVSYFGGPFALLLLAWAIFAWLKRRLEPFEPIKSSDT